MATILTMDSSVQVNSGDIIFQEMQGEAVLLNLKTGIYFGLDSVGVRAWQLLELGGPLSGVVDTIVGEFEVSREEFTEHLLSLLAELESHSLVTVA
jgi:hypothetical protein